MEEKRNSIAKKVHKWLRGRPYLLYGLKRNLINFSSLTREIQRELEIKKFDAVIVAVRRFQKEAEALGSPGKEIIELLKKSRLELRTGINVYIVNPLEVIEISKSDYSHLISGTSTKTIITNKRLDIKTIKKHENAIEVAITGPEDIEKTPGFVSYIFSALAEKDINIIETYSCYTDTIFIFNRKDLSRVIETLESIGIK